ncbi:histidine--tRNA ligase [Candidatus Nomurabacteria bacterium]|nr:histidine--tRNA ligase [Candidatus Nomurabacteria bacterium]
MPPKKKTTKSVKKKAASAKKSTASKKASKVAPKKKVTAKKTAPKKAASGSAKKITKVNKSVRTPQSLRGMRDIHPKDAAIWKELFHNAENIAESYGFARLQTPILEEASLFIKSIGKGTDIIDKEMYVFDFDGNKLALQPEMTAVAVRSFINHGMHVDPQPVKMWYFSPMYRHDRPQAGRYRQFYQFGAETFGEKNPVIDAELIVAAYNFVKDCGIDAQVRVNSIGSLEDRKNYIVELVGYLRSKRSYLSEESKKRINKNPLRILDSKDEGDRMVIEDAPQIIDWLSEDSKNYFMKILEYLDELEVPYVLDPTLVRGLDYYCDTVFEIFYESHDEESNMKELALGGGGRYDGLVEMLGGQPTDGCGFSMGVDRLALILKQRQAQEGILTSKKPCVYMAHLGDQANRRMLKIIEDLRREGIQVKHNLAKASLKGQLEQASRQGCSHAFILGQKEVQDGTIIVRDMDSGSQETIDQKKIGREITKLLG